MPKSQQDYDTMRLQPAVVLSTDQKPDYLFCLPIAATTWALSGFFCHLIVCGKNPSSLWRDYLDPSYYCYHNPVDTLKACPNNPALFSQCARMYLPANLKDKNQYVVLGDVDMLIGSSFLNRDFDRPNVFGHDLTGFRHIPMCYVGMPVHQWVKVMGTPNQEYCGIEDDLKLYADLSTPKRAWTSDQDILTGRLRAYGYEKINFISRGTDPANDDLPIGRWDRHGRMKRPGGTVHDVHLMRRPYTRRNTEKIITICNDLYPAHDWMWIRQFRDAFIKGFE